MVQLRLIQGGKGRRNTAGAPPPKYGIGQLVHHVLFNYRGVVVSVDQCFQGSEEWYENVARSRPPKDQPWYEVLVDEATHSTYVAERHLEPDNIRRPIDHPLVEHFFGQFKNGHYSPLA